MFGKSIFKNYSGFINIFSRFSDPVVVILAAYTSFVIRFGQFHLNIPKDYRILMLFSFLCVLLIFPLFNLYSSWRGQSLFRQARTVLMAWSAVVLIVITILFGLKISAEYSRLWLTSWAILGLVFLLITRISIYYFLQYQRKHGRNIRSVVIVGAGDLGKRTLKRANDASWMGYKVKAFFDDNAKLKNQYIDGVEVKGSLSEVEPYLTQNEIDEIWIALPLRSEERMKKLLTDLSLHTVNIKLIPDIFGFSLLHHSLTEIAGLPAVNLSVSPMDGLNRVIKAIEDRIIAALILILISPLMVVLSIGVKLSSPGPVFYRQERISWNNKPIMMLKFRSMPVNDEKDGAVWGNAQAKEVTKFGKFIRKTSLDELPQFINVLLGDMSIVGPRPERTEFVEKFKREIPGYMQKHMMKAGITGWAQINGWRGDTCLKSRVEHDLYYIENWSLWFDLKIIFLTVFKGFVNKNAY